ncbi:serine hydrolase [Oceanobacillus luteolus]|uniref:Serine hydrolase n=1 Tax=Oceanobacillus luteolus TaxID=1274358 RepID=A0ABW4HNN3_9BACI
MLELTQQITDITGKAGGSWGISLFDLNNEKSWGQNEHRPFYAASIIKIPIMIAVFAAAERKEVNLKDTLILEQEDIVGGCGVLQHMTPGIRLTIEDLVTLMIIQSDNTATNMLIDFLGVQEIQQTMKNIGLRQSNFFHKMMIGQRDSQRMNVVTADEMTRMLKSLYLGRIVSEYASTQMLQILKKQQIRDSLPSKIRHPDKATGNLQWELANKTGNVPGIRHDIGLFSVGERVIAVSVLSEGADDFTSAGTIGEIGLMIHKYLAQSL